MKMLSLLNTTYSTNSEVLAAAQAYAKESGFAVVTKRSNDKSIYIKCIHGGQYKNCHGLTEDDRKLNRPTVRCDCPWQMRASFAKPLQKWVVRFVEQLDAHNHDMVKDTRIYHQHRKSTNEVQEKIFSMTANENKPAKIYEEIRADDGTPVMTMKDIYTFREKIFAQDRSGHFSKLFEFLITREYVVRYNLADDGKVSDAVFISHSNAIHKARCFPEVVLIDATYKTSSTKMPLVNIVGISNLGSKKLRTFLIASALVTNEK